MRGCTFLEPVESLNKVSSRNYHESCSLSSDKLFPEGQGICTKEEVSRGSSANRVEKIDKVEIRSPGHGFCLDASEKPLNFDAESYAKETDGVIDNSLPLHASRNKLLGSPQNRVVRDSILSSVDADRKGDSFIEIGLGDFDGVGNAKVFSAILPPVSVNEANGNVMIQQMESGTPSENCKEVPFNSLGNTFNAGKDVACSEPSELQISMRSIQPGRSFTTKLDSSWPQRKRRKIWGQLTDVVSSSLSMGVRQDRNIHDSTTNGHLNSVSDNLKAVINLQPFPIFHEDGSQLNADERPDSGMCQYVACHMKEGLESSPKLREEGGFSLKGTNRSGNMPISFKDSRLESFYSLSLTKPAPGDSQLCLGLADPVSVVHDISRQCAVDRNQDFLDSAERSIQEMKSGDGLFSRSLGSSHNSHLDLVNADQDMPVFEGFFMQTENGQLCTLGDEISYDELDVANSALKRASVLGQLCKSASMHTPLSQFSNAYKFCGTPALHESPDEFLGCKDLRSTLHIEKDSGMQPEASYTDCQLFSSVRTASDISKPCTSPVGKLWEGFTFKFNSGSSVRQGNSNPELACFPIKEEENGNTDEVVDAFLEDNCLMAEENSAKREPLAEIKEECSNPPVDVSAAEMLTRRESVESVNTEINFTETHNPREHDSKRRVMKEGKENHCLLGANGVKKVTESLRGRASKQKLSGKGSLRSKGPQMFKRDSKHNNIVSNITSFIPLVQQKQAAAVLTGKRDVKVKALEAAEAAKRLEEKKENERKMKKEAMKLQRTKLEQEKEQKKKRKEKEQKKNDADMAAKKRMREEGERKEKERKRKRIEEVRQQTHNEGKPCAGKVECQVLDDRQLDCGRKKLENEAAKHVNIQKGKGEDDPRKMTDTELGTRRSSIFSDKKGSSVTENCDASSDYGDIGKVTSKLDIQNDNSATNTSREQSYELSPYQGSDGEDEEEEDIPNRKFIPSWASKSSLVRVAYSQQNVDTNVIFPPEMFCDIDEVLFPRNQSPKQVAT